VRSPGPEDPVEIVTPSALMRIMFYESQNIPLYGLIAQFIFSHHAHLLNVICPENSFSVGRAVHLSSTWLLRHMAQFRGKSDVGYNVDGS